MLWVVCRQPFLYRLGKSCPSTTQNRFMGLPSCANRWRTLADMGGRFPATVRLLQLCVLRFRLCQDGNISVGVFPECEEVLVGGFRFGRVALHGISSTQLQVR